MNSSQVIELGAVTRQHMGSRVSTPLVTYSEARLTEHKTLILQSLVLFTQRHGKQLQQPASGSRPSAQHREQLAAFSSEF